MIFRTVYFRLVKKSKAHTKPSSELKSTCHHFQVADEAVCSDSYKIQLSCRESELQESLVSWYFHCSRCLSFKTFGSALHQIGKVRLEVTLTSFMII